MVAIFLGFRVLTHRCYIFTARWAPHSSHSTTLDWMLTSRISRARPTPAWTSAMEMTSRRRSSVWPLPTPWLMARRMISSQWTTLPAYPASPWWEEIITPDNKVHGANMGPIWGREDPGGHHVGPMNFAIWASAYDKSGRYDIRDDH